MPRLRSNLRELTQRHAIVKQETAIEIDSTDIILVNEQDNVAKPSLKRKRSSVTQSTDLNPGNDLPGQYVKVEEISGSHERQQTRSSPRVKKAPVGRYHDTCHHFKKSFDILPVPSRTLGKIPPDAYQRSFELNVFMGAEYEEKHQEWVKLRDLRAQLNAKVASQKKALAETKELYQKAGVQVEMYKRDLQEANMQLTLKVARPISHAQTKLENAHEDYANEMTEFRARLFQEKSGKEAAQKKLAIAESDLADALAKPNSWNPDNSQELDHLRRDLEDERKLRGSFEASAKQLAITNAQLETRTQEVEAEMSRNETQMRSAAKLADIKVADERRSFQEEIKELKAVVQEKEQALGKQRATFLKLSKLSNLLED